LDHLLLKSFLDQYNIDHFTATPMDGYSSQNYKISTGGDTYVLKLYEGTIVNQQFMQAENDILLLLDHQIYPLPFKNNLGSYITKATINQQAKIARLLSFLEGDFLAEVEHSEMLIRDFGAFIARLDQKLSNYQNFPIQAKKEVWDLQYNHLSKKYLTHINAVETRRVAHHFLLQYQMKVNPIVEELRQQIIHGDANDWNVLVNADDHKKISGIIDFGDACFSPLINDVAIALAYVMFDKENPLKWGSYFLKGFNQVFPLQEIEVDILYYLIGARLSVSLCQSAYHQKQSPYKTYISISEQQASRLIHQWIRINPVKAKATFRKALGWDTLIVDNINEDLKRRHQHTSKAMSLTFSKPINIVGAAMQYMYDKVGNTYLDLYNNIPQVGHEHPTIVEAAQRQMAQLNTNSRYLNEVYLQYIEALLKKFPQTLNKVFLVNSGSAASDLAMRLAFTHTKRTQILAMEHGYHGNSQLGIDISHYKFGGKGGTGKKNNISIAKLPSEYRGKFATDKNAGKRYAEDCIKQLKIDGIPIAAFITECIVGCGGQVPLAEGYLSLMFDYIHTQGGLCICDEVQTGFGRTGNHYWAYEQYRVVPDIVIIGKPMANGHPIGAVVTTDAIAQSFENGMEFFSSFGGNPVSCAIGLAVLQVIEDEALQEQAKQVGNYFKERLKDLANQFDTIGDIRGEGLFLGIDLVISKEDQTPNTTLAQKLKNELKGRGYLVGSDGPFDNVIKIKPPLVFTKNNVNEFVGVFKESIKCIF